MRTIRLLAMDGRGAPSGLRRPPAARRRVRTATVAVSVAATGLIAGLGAAPAAAAAPARVNVVHGIPGVAVKVCVDGKAVVDHFRYGSTIVGAALPATTHRVRVVAAGKACRSSAILRSAYTLAAGRNYTIVANLNAHGSPNLKAFVNNVRPTAHGKARVTVRHTADAPAVNVWAGRTKIIGGTHFTWGRSATLAVPAGRYVVRVSLPKSTKAVIGPARASLAAGRAYQVYAVGLAGHYRLITIKIPVGTR